MQARPAKLAVARVGRLASAPHLVVLERVHELVREQRGVAAIVALLAAIDHRDLLRARRVERGDVVHAVVDRGLHRRRSSVLTKPSHCSATSHGSISGFSGSACGRSAGSCGARSARRSARRGTARRVIVRIGGNALERIPAVAAQAHDRVVDVDPGSSCCAMLHASSSALRPQPKQRATGAARVLTRAAAQRRSRVAQSYAQRVTAGLQHREVQPPIARPALARERLVERSRCSALDEARTSVKRTIGSSESCSMSGSTVGMNTA